MYQETNVEQCLDAGDTPIVNNTRVTNDNNEDQGPRSIEVAQQHTPTAIESIIYQNESISPSPSNNILDDPDYEWIIYGGDHRRRNHNENSLDDSSDTSTSYGGVMHQYEALIGTYGNCCDGSFGLLTENEINEMKNEILRKPKPRHVWNAVANLYYRELGLTGRHKKFIVGPNSNMFQYRFYGSLYVMERLQLMPNIAEYYTFEAYSLHFDKTGSVLVFGSDDFKITLWKWSTDKIVYNYDSPHNSYAFETKILELGGSINIISRANGGEILSALVPSSGGEPIITCLLEHADKVHNFVLPPTSPYQVLSAGQDARVFRYDFRENVSETILSVKENGKHVPLYSIAAHPIDDEFCIGGGDQFVRVYDKRNLKEPVKKFAPKHLLSELPYTPCITCVVYNYIGNEILTAYNSNEIFLFANEVDVEGNYLHKYKGNSNYFPLKVNFFGPRSEFIMSGSNCGNCFFWDKNTEAIVQWLPGFGIASIKCPEPHPSFPILATSGEESIQIWGPSHESTPNFSDLCKCIDMNLRENQCHNYTYYNYSGRSD